ncbi:MAG TPA: CAP domain-containing protein [Sphingomicrobium sp.]
MTRLGMAAVLLTLALATPAGASDPLAPLPPGATSTVIDPRFHGATGELAARLLAAHNRERALVGHSPLSWDPNLAASAASYGPILASLHQLIHSPRETRPGQRENLARAFHGTMNAEQLVDLWSREKLMLRPGLFPAVSRTGQWEDVAHYTQMVWPTTTRVGCAIFAADWDYLICRYSPPGNIDGKPVFASAPVMVTQVAARTGN